MSSSVFDILNWTASTIYGKDDIVRYLNFYYYAKIRHVSAGSFDSSKWVGITTFNSDTKPHFTWIPSYEGTPVLEPKVKSIKFGDGYEQRLPDGINNNLLKLNLSFNGRDLSETTAIIHFLRERNGVESFVFTPLPPFGKAKLFKCPNVTSPFIFYNNYNISVNFEEVPN